MSQAVRIGSLERAERLTLRSTFLYLLYAPLTIPLVYCHINSFRRASSLARPSQGGEKRTAVWASRPEDLLSDGVVSPHVFDHMVVPALGVVLHWCNRLGSAVDAGLDATARALRAERAANGAVVYEQIPRSLRQNSRLGEQ